MDRGAALSALLVLLIAGSNVPAHGFLFGILTPFFQGFPIFGLRTYVTPTQVGGVYINAFPFTTPPAGRSRADPYPILSRKFSWM
jgi:hypothetical protein